MQGNVSMNQDGDHITGLAIKTPLSLVRHHDHLAPALHGRTSWSGPIAEDLVEPCSLKSKDPGALDMSTAQPLPWCRLSAGALEAHLSSKKDKPDISVKILVA
jgi:hypothetical protein